MRNRQANTKRVMTGRPSGFTLVELLVVILIISILVGLVASIGKYVRDKGNSRETEQTQTIVMSAVEAFKDIAGQYPAGNGDQPSEQGLLDQLRGQGPAAGLNDEQKAAIRKACGDRLTKLPQGALTDDLGIKDAYGTYMRYNATGSLGGKPVVISAGPDRQFPTADDIRSDAHL